MRKPPEAPKKLDFADSGVQRSMGNSLYWEAAKEIDQKYRHWAKVRYIARDKKLIPEHLWMIVKLGRSQRYRVLPLAGDGQSPIRYTVPDYLQKELMLIDQQLAGRLLSQDDQPINPAHQEQYVISALREEAIASSMLEGAVTTRSDAKKMLRRNRAPRTLGERMVLNNYRTITFIRENRNVPLTPDFIVEIQEMLTRDTLEDSTQCGRLRIDSDNVRIEDGFDEVVHVPPPADELAHRLQMLCDFANAKQDAREFVHPVIKACILHFQIGFDHPFCDGNGRTARALFYWSMLRSGYWLFEYLPISRLIYESPAKYSLAFMYAETDEFDATYFLMYKARIIARARRELGEYILRKQMEIAGARRIFESDSMLNHRQRELIVKMLRSPYLAVTIQDHQGHQNVAYGTARSDLINLEDLGYLTRSRLGSKRFEFVKGPKLENSEVDF